MSIVNFLYKGVETTVQCQENEKMKEICNKFGIKVEQDINNLYFMYNGDIVDMELKYKDIINEVDKKRNKINILVEEYKKEDINEENKIISKDIICPECKENILITMNDDYKINLNGCKNGHNFNNILLNEFENKQMIDISKIICGECQIKNKSNTHDNEMYKCIECKKNICPLCKLNHDKSHKIINYELQDYICNNHIDVFTKYCNDCQKNICRKCEREHKSHNSISLGEMIPDNENEELKKYIDKLKTEIDDIIIKLKNIKDNLELYYKISNNITIFLTIKDFYYISHT